MELDRAMMIQEGLKVLTEKQRKELLVYLLEKERLGKSNDRHRVSHDTTR